MYFQLFQLSVDCLNVLIYGVGKLINLCCFVIKQTFPSNH